MDRGFDLMIPKAKEEIKEETIFKQLISFSIFGKTFELSFKVKETQE